LNNEKKKISRLIKYQKLKSVVWSKWSDTHRRHMWWIAVQIVNWSSLYRLYHCTKILIIIHHMCLLCIYLHILQTTIFNFLYFIISAILFYYSTANFNQNYMILKVTLFISIRMSGRNRLW